MDCHQTTLSPGDGGRKKWDKNAPSIHVAEMKYRGETFNEWVWEKKEWKKWKEKFNYDEGNENRDAGTGIDHIGNHAHSSNSTVDSELKIDKKTKKREEG